MKHKKASLLLASILSIGSVNSFAVENQDSKLPLKEISKIAEVFSKIENNYVDNVNSKELALSALSGMVESLDPYSKYLPAEDLTAFEEDIQGEMFGIGAVLSNHEKGLKVETVLRGSPASKTSLKSGDVIIKVNDKYIIDEYEKPLDAVKDIKGEKDTKVKLTVLVDNESIETFDITRDKFVVPSARVVKLDGNIGLIQLSVFQANTSDELFKELTAFQKKNKNIDGYILDLRSNPGGVLSGAINISDLFLDKGLIVSTKGRTKEDISETYAEKGDILRGKPMVVLIDSGSASASEIVAGALQDNKRALIVGQKSYGKGSVQTIIPLKGNDGDALKLTIARYYTPSGRSIQAEGIVPDIRVERVKNIELFNGKVHRESDNANHINNDTDYKAEKNVNDEDKDEIHSSIQGDYSLHIASNTLKTLMLSK